MQLNNVTAVIKNVFPQAVSDSKPEVNYFISLCCTMSASVKHPASKKQELVI